MFASLTRATLVCVALMAVTGSAAVAAPPTTRPVAQYRVVVTQVSYDKNGRWLDSKRYTLSGRYDLNTAISKASDVRGTTYNFGRKVVTNATVEYAK